jgi:hypothetical protein
MKGNSVVLGTVAAFPALREQSSASSRATSYLDSTRGVVPPQHAG